MNAERSTAFTPDPDDDDPFSPTWRFGAIFDEIVENAEAEGVGE